MNVKPYAKLIAALVGAVAIFGTAASDQVITNTEWVTIGLSVLSAFGVYQVPNRPSFQ